jgi:tRNA (cytidine/uridine-2'-O-)-methyltransferase
LGRLHIALIAPEIPGNTGNIGRLAIGIGAHLHLVHPLGFSTSEKAVRRAGIDHWKHVQLREHSDSESFLQWVGERPMACLSARGTQSYGAIPIGEELVLVFGCESTGLPADWVERFGAFRIPSPGPVRSLNLSNAVAVVAYHALSCMEPALFEGPYV